MAPRGLSLSPHRRHACVLHASHHRTVCTAPDLQLDPSARFAAHLTPTSLTRFPLAA